MSIPELVQHLEWEGHLLSLDFSLLIAPAAAGLVAGLLMLWTTLQTRTWRGVRSRSFALIALAGLFGAAPAALFAVFPAKTSSAWSQFPQAAWGASCLAGLGLTAIFMANVEVLERRWEEQPAQWLLLPQGVMGALACWLAAQAGLELRRAGPLPELSLQTCQEVHVGVPCTPKLQLLELGVQRRAGLFDDTLVKVYFVTDEHDSVASSFRDARGWSVPEVQIEAAEPGEHVVELSARRGWMQVRREARYRAQEPTWSPRFAPETGSFWRLQRYQEVGGERLALFIKNPPRREDQEPLELRVLGEETLPVGLRARELRVGEQAWWLTGLDGETWVVDPRSGERSPAIRFTGEPMDFADFVMGRVRLARGLQAQTCEVAFFPGWSCTCVDGPIDAARSLPGVAMCTEVTDRVGPVLVGVLTMGFVAPRPDQRVMLLEASGVADSPP